MSKGSKQRPIEDKKQFDENWDRIFKKPQKTLCDNFGICNCIVETNRNYNQTKENAN